MKKVNSIVKNTLLKLIASAAVKTAEKSANSTCDWWAYQPKTPQALKSLRKF